MIARITGKFIKKNDLSVLLEVQGFCYEVIVPVSVLQRLDEHVSPEGILQLVTYYYLQLSPSRGQPVLVGFLNEIESDFFQQFIKVSGIGPRAAVKAIDRPISEIALAIDKGDFGYLKSLPGIGAQKAKEIIAKLQGKVGKYCLLQDQVTPASPPTDVVPQWQEEALAVLLQLQYTRQEAGRMIQKALGRAPQIATAEELLNEIYKQRKNG